MNDKRKNRISIILFLISYSSFICLFTDISVLSIFLSSVFYFAGSLFYIFKLPELDKCNNRIHNILLSIPIIIVGFFNFRYLWYPPERVEALASNFRLSGENLILIVDTLGCLVGYYAVYHIAGIINSYLYKFIEKYSPGLNYRTIIKNLKNNVFLLFSAISFFILNINSFYYEKIMSFLISSLIWVVIIVLVPSIFHIEKNKNKLLKILSFLTSIGICLANKQYFSNNMIFYLDSNNILINNEIVNYGSVIISIIAVHFVYLLVAKFFMKISSIFIQNKVFEDINKKEILLYSLIIIFLIVMVIFAYTKSNAFYGKGLGVDIIYTSDSCIFVDDNVFLNLNHIENDIRQPLFSLFSAPFFGISYLIIKFLNLSITVEAVLISSTQIVLLVFSHFLLAKTLNLDSGKRMAFVLFLSSMFFSMLFSITIEQYVITYFWLVLSIYIILNNKIDLFPIYAATGTLITNVLLFLLTTKSKVKKFKDWFINIMECGLMFIFIMLSFNRYEVIFNLSSRLSFLGKFSGEGLKMIEKVYQYIAFVINCFIFPNSNIVKLPSGSYSWQLKNLSTFSVFGFLIIIACIVGYIKNRKDKENIISALWFLFSFIMLVIVGWGTSENGLILYSLYFGWSFAILIFKLLIYLDSKIRVKYFSLIVFIIIILFMIVFNMDGILKIIAFARSYYPV